MILQERKNVAHKWEALNFPPMADNHFPDIFVRYLCEISAANKNVWWLVEYRSNRILISYRNHPRGVEGGYKVPYTANHDDLYRILAETVDSTDNCRIHNVKLLPDGSSLNVVQIRIVNNWAEAEVQ